MKIIEFNPNAECLNEIMSFNDFYNKTGEDFYFQIGKYMYCLHKWATDYDYTMNYTLTDITTAGVPGKVCHSYRISGKIKEISSLFEHNFDDVYFQIATNSFENVTVYKSVIKAIDVFNPMTIKQTYKPLKEEPSKWTIKHALRAIVHHQFENLMCDGYYTDDYAWDNANNYGIKEIKYTADFLKKIIEHKNGWRVYKYDDRICINCYHFDTNSFKLKLA